MFENSENERFDFYIKVTPKDRGDYGGIKISGLYRSVKDCLYIFKEMKEQILRHVDDVKSVDIVIDDVYGEYKTFESEWEANKYKNSELKDLPKKEINEEE